VFNGLAALAGEIRTGPAGCKNKNKKRQTKQKTMPAKTVSKGVNK
jgi:hypothetical protein